MRQNLFKEPFGAYGILSSIIFAFYFKVYQVNALRKVII